MIAQIIMGSNFERRWRLARTPQQFREVFLMANRIRVPKLARSSAS